MRNEIDAFKARWLSGVSNETIIELRRASEIISFQEGDTVYALGGPQKWLWGIVSGQAQVRVALIETEQMLGHIHLTGAWFGESELIQGIDGLIEVKATEPTKVVRIPYTPFRRLADARPELWRAFALLTSMNQLLAMSAANDLTLRKPRQRIAATLLRLCGKRANFQSTETVSEVKASQQDIASLANIARSKASIHLKELENAGYIVLNYGRVEVLSANGLLSIIEE